MIALALGARFQRVRARLKREAIPVPHTFAEATALRAFSDLDGPGSVALGRRIVEQRMRLTRLAAARNPDAGRAALALEAPAMRAAAAALADLEAQARPVVLALPATLDALALLAWLRTATGRTLVIEATALSEPFRPALTRSRGPAGCEMLAPSALVRRNKERAPAERLTFATFPDHRVAPLGSSREHPFLGENQRFSLLEPLLYFRGAQPLITLAVGEDGITPQAVRYGRTAGRPPSEDDALAIIAWIAGATDELLRARPERALSFAAIKRSASKALEVGRVLDLRLLAAFVRTWNAAANEALDDDTARWALDELARRGAA